MHYILFLQIPGFFVRVWEERDSDRASQPLAIHHDRKILDRNDVASKMGVQVGMGLEEAKALLLGMGLVAYEDEPYRDARDRWLDVASEFSSVIEPSTQAAAWLDLTGNPDPFDMASRIVRALKMRFECQVRSGMAGTKWLASLASELIEVPGGPRWEDAMREALLHPARFLSDLPTAALAPVEPKHRERLKFLGYRTIGEVASIPLRTLKAQFDDSALAIHRAAHGGPYEPVRALYPPDSIAERLCFEGGLDNEHEVGLALEKLARRLAKKLSDRESQGTILRLQVEHEQQIVDASRTFSQPIRTSRQVFSALTRLIGAPTEPVYALRASMPRLSKAKERQAGLFSARAPGDDIAVSRAVDQVRNVFGDASIQRASERVEPRRVRVLRAWSHATGWK